MAKRKNDNNNTRNTRPRAPSGPPPTTTDHTITAPQSPVISNSNYSSLTTSPISSSSPMEVENNYNMQEVGVPIPGRQTAILDQDLLELNELNRQLALQREVNRQINNRRRQLGGRRKTKRRKSLKKRRKTKRKGGRKRRNINPASIPE
tara:strand:+ start:1982 stop:2428 length:447 start_codon:yes stop_codon:yes gene_type:complete